MDITQGRLGLEGCDISSLSSACVGIHDGADPRLRRNKIHDGEDSCVYVYNGGLGTPEDNDIVGNTFAGVEIREGGSPTLLANGINRNGKIRRYRALFKTHVPPAECDAGIHRGNPGYVAAHHFPVCGGPGTVWMGSWTRP